MKKLAVVYLQESSDLAVVVLCQRDVVLLLLALSRVTGDGQTPGTVLHTPPPSKSSYQWSTLKIKLT